MKSRATLSLSSPDASMIGARDEKALLSALICRPRRGAAFLAYSGPRVETAVTFIVLGSSWSWIFVCQFLRLALIELKSPAAAANAGIDRADVKAHSRYVALSSSDPFEKIALVILGSRNFVYNVSISSGLTTRRSIQFLALLPKSDSTIWWILSGVAFGSVATEYALLRAALVRLESPWSTVLEINPVSPFMTRPTISSEI